MAYDIIKIKERFKEVCDSQDCQVEVPIIENPRLRTTLGRVMLHGTKSYCYPTRVEFSTHLINTGSEEDIEEVVRHEAAHYIVTQKTKQSHGHDKVFKNMCMKLDCKFDTAKTSLNTPAEEKEYKYLVKCPDCGITIKGYKRKCKSLYDAENGKSCCPKCGTSRLRIQENWI